jgi:transcriptional regulator with XRE-family HTH domain
MKSSIKTYVDLDGHAWDLALLTVPERRIVAELQNIVAASSKDADDPVQIWCNFDNAWSSKVHALLKKRGISSKRISETALFQIAHDLSGRLAIALGIARKATYRDHLEEIIESRFKTRRAFCEATGLSEDMLSHVLAGRKDLSIETLTKALDRIGYTIKFVPRDPGKTKSA